MSSIEATAASARPPLPAEAPISAEVPQAADPGAFARLVGGLGRELERGEILVERASRGELGRLDAAALIAVQAGIYRYTEALDLSAKVVDRTSSGLRTVLQSGGA